MPPRPWAPAGDSRTVPLDWALQEREPSEKSVQAVHAALSNPDTEPEVVGDCVEKLSEWLRRYGTQAQRLISQARLAPVLVQVMRKHGEDVEVARHCCRVISGVANRHAENAGAFVRAGGVVALNDLVDWHLSDVVVQETGIMCLVALAEKVAAREVIATGGVGRCLRTLCEHSSNAFVQRSCWRCLDLLVANGTDMTDAMRREVADVADLVMRATRATLASNHPKERATKQVAERLVAWVQSCVRELAQPQAPAAQKGTRAKDEVRCEELPPVTKELEDLRGWLQNMDPTGALALYHSVLAENFDSVAHILDAYAEGGKVDPQFFEDVGVKKIGHRRKFEQWFEQHLSSPASGTSGSTT